MLSYLYKELLTARKPPSIIAALQKIMSFILSSKIQVSDGAVSLFVKPTLIEAYYWNNESGWADPFVHKNSAQKGSANEFLHFYLRRLPAISKPPFLDKRNGLDLVMGDRSDVFLSFLIKRSLVSDTEYTESKLANLLLNMFACTDQKCTGVSATLIFEKPIAVAYQNRNFGNTKNNGGDSEKYRNMLLSAKTLDILDCFGKEKTNEEISFL